MRFRHPDARPVAVDVNGETVAPDDSGVYESAAATEAWLDTFAAAHGTDAEAIRVSGASDGAADDDSDSDESDAPSGTCEVVKQDGDVCGRERPCRYHD